MEGEKLYQIALGLIPGVGDILTKQLVSYCGSARQVFSQPKAKLSKIPGVGEKLLSQLGNKSVLEIAEANLAKCEAQNVRVLFYTDPDYPSRLKKINDSPALLYYKGNGILEYPRTVGIVGTRKATPYGKAVVEELCKDLSALGVATISGLAYGIDIAAHRESLKQGIPTFGVIAGGLDKIYPSVHKATSNEMLEKGGLLTENPLGTQPEAHFFPARNRIIAGLSDALIVVESQEKGGSLVTAHIAFSYDKDVFAVPGNINNPYSKGCNQLIVSHNAIPYTQIKDLIVNMNWDTSHTTVVRTKVDYSQFEPQERHTLETLREFPDGITIDQLAWKTQLPINKMASVLLTLEFQGLVKSQPGKKFKLT